MKFAARKFVWIGGCLIAASVVGALVGIPMALLAVAFSDAALESWRRDPWRWISHGVGMGVYLSVLSYFFIGFQADYINRQRPAPPSDDVDRSAADLPEHLHKGRRRTFATFGVIFAAAVLLAAMALGTMPTEGRLARVSIIAAAMGVVLGQMLSSTGQAAQTAWRQADLRNPLR